MRIAFLGKGGAGKTTTCAGFIKFAADKFPFVMAVDADVNAHLRQALHLPELEGKEIQLGESCEEIFEYLKGNRKDLGERHFLGTTPPSLESNFVVPNKDDAFISKYAQTSGNIAVLTVGTYNESDVGGSCYHTKLRGLASIFHHLLDSETDIVVADTTAGTDNLATSLSFAYDMNVFVVEPTEKSVRVYSDFIKTAPALEERVFVIANKVDGDEDRDFIEASVPKDKIIGMVPHSRHLKRFEQGDKEALEKFQKEQRSAFGNLITVLQKRQRNWTNYLSMLRAAHEKICKDWYNDYYGQILDQDLDAEFTYQKAMAQKNNALSKKLNSVLVTA